MMRIIVSHSRLCYLSEQRDVSSRGRWFRSDVPGGWRSAGDGAASCCGEVQQHWTKQSGRLLSYSGRSGAAVSASTHLCFSLSRNKWWFTCKGPLLPQWWWQHSFCPCAPLCRCSAPGTSWRHTVWKNTRYNRKLCCTLTGEVLTDGPASGLTLMLCFHSYQFGDAVQRRGRSAGHGSG